MRPEELDHVYAGLVLRKRADALLVELSGLKRHPHEDSIHDTRVQSRRMRAALEAFQDLFPPSLWKAVYEPVRSITRNLGKARETEVSLSLLDQLAGSAGLPEKVCAEYLEQKLRRRLWKLRKRLKRNLRKIDVRNLRSRFRSLLSEVGRKEDTQPKEGIVIPIKYGRGSTAGFRAAGGTRQSFLFPLHGETMERTRRVLGELAAALLAFRTRADFRRASDARLHRLRISTKKLRYAMEIFDEAWTGGLKQQIELARVLQDAGGRHQDWAVLRNRLQNEIRRLTRENLPHLASQVGRILADAEDHKATSRGEILPALTQLQASLKALLQNPPLASPRGIERDEAAGK